MCAYMCVEGVCVFVCKCTMLPMYRSEDNLWELILSLEHVNPEEGINVVELIVDVFTN